MTLIRILLYAYDMMIAEILSTGDEIRTGSVVDSNAAHIARELEAAGIEVIRHTCVGDDPAQLKAALTEIGNRADVAVVTGGLGPTADDLTAEAAASAAGVTLAVDPGALEQIETFFSRRHRPMSRSNRKQALIPVGAECILNPVGTAPGFLLTLRRCSFFFLPGVPSEMRHMLSKEVLPRIQRMRGAAKEISLLRNLSIFGLPESVVGEKMEGFADEFPGVKVGYRAVFPVTYLKLCSRGTDASALGRQMDQACREALDRIGESLYSVDGETMETVVGRLLRKRNATVAVAESCTGGLVAHRLTAVPGSSDYFLFSGVTYANQAKRDILGVPEEILARYGAVHEETARMMAAGARRIAGATYGLSTSGIAGPDGGTPEKPVGTVCIGLATPRGARGHRFHFSFGDREMMKRIFAVKALDLLRCELLSDADSRAGPTIK